jgi:hypothetical protein
VKEFSESQSLATDLPRWLDRLVDGELNRDQQRQLLVALEAEPEGWRRCALAFVEAQAWRHELCAFDVRSELPATRSHESTRTSAATAWRLRSHYWKWFAIAGCLLLAFGLGAGAGEFWQGRNSTGQIANHSATAAPNEQLVANAAPSTNLEDPSANPTNWQALKVTIPSVDGQSDQTMEVPLVEGNEQRLQSLLADQSPILPVVTRQMLESSGNEVAEHRAYYPVKLEDGRQAVVPMDYVEVRHTGGWQ